MRKSAILAVVGTALILIAVAVPCVGADTWTQVIPGVQHLHRTTSMPWDIHVVLVDLTNPRVRLRVAIKNDNDYPGDGGETVRSMCRRYGAVAGINTDFWGGTPVANCPQGHTWTDGLKMLPPGWVSPPSGGRTHMQIPADNAFVIVNKVVSQPAWFFNVTGGGPRVIRDGVVGWEWEPDLPNMTDRHPRTGAAVTQDYGTLILATCDGRQASSVGMTANEMGYLLKEFGGYQGMMFDGGGSTTMVINGQTVNSPSDGTDRRVAAGLMVLDRLVDGPWVPAAPPGSGLVRPGHAVSFESGFENPPYSPGSLGGQDGWTGGGIVVAEGRVGGQCARFSGSAAYHTHPSTPYLQAVQWVESWMKTSSTAARAYMYAGSADLVYSAAVVRFNTDGKIEALDGNGTGGGTWYPLADYSADAWYRIHVRLDYNLNRYQVFVNGSLKISGIGFRHSGASAGLRSVGFEQSGGANLWVDDVYLGNTDPNFLRVSPNTALITAGGRKAFGAVGGSPPAGWSVVEEKHPGGSPAPPGAIAHIDAQGVLRALAPGTCVVRAQDSIGRVDDSGQISVLASVSIEESKSLPDGANAAVSGLLVTGVYDGFIYAQRPDRASGIRISTTKQPAVGDEIFAIGTMSTAGGERVLAAGIVEVCP